MTTITKERLQEVIDGDILFTDEQRELARIALASLDADQPVPEEIPKGLAGQIVGLLAHNIGDKLLAQKIWNACRDAMLQDNQRDLSQPVDPQVAEYEQIMLQAGNSPISPDGWISCSERMPAQDDWVLIYSKYGEYLAGQVQGEYVELNDGTLSWLGAALHWMPLPEPPQEVK